MTNSAETTQRARVLLEDALDRAAGRAPELELGHALPSWLDAACREVIFEPRKDPLRMAALTITAVIAADPSQDPQRIQGGFNFRDAYKQVARTALRREAELQNLRFEPTKDAFVSNPLREPRLDAQWLTTRRMVGAQQLVRIAEHLANHPEHAASILNLLASNMLALLLVGQITYRVPPRASLDQVVALLQAFLAESSGGDRLERVMVVALRRLGQVTGAWKRVEAHPANADLPYDALCWIDDERVVAVAEAKDQYFDIAYLRQLREEMRAVGARSGYYVTRALHMEDRQGEISSFIDRSFSSGESIHVLDINELTFAVLLAADVTAEAASDFIRLLAVELDTYSSTQDRQAFARLLEEI